MRPLFVFISVVGLCSSGCRCSPATPSAVTVRVKNASRDPIFVNDTEAALGVAIQRTVGGMPFSFDEHPCECKTCDFVCANNCAGCADAGVSFIRRIEPGESASRTWDGVVQVSAYACGRACLGAENAPLDETFIAHLCYTNDLTGFLGNDAGRAEGPFPNDGVTCVDKQFKPSDGVVEVGPERGAACVTGADCTGIGELCFSGSCTSGCPANAAPSAPGLQVASITNRGFFTVSPSSGRSIATGSGTVTASTYNGSTLTVQLSRRGAANEALTGSVQVTMPTREGPALATNAPVTVTVIDASTMSNVNNRGVVMRDSNSNQLLFAADVAQSSRVLGASDIAPFTIIDGTVPTGCRLDACGKALFVSAKVNAGGASVDIESGERASVKAGTATYSFVNAFDVSYAKTTCDYGVLRPYAMWLQ